MLINIGFSHKPHWKTKLAALRSTHNIGIVFTHLINICIYYIKDVAICVLYLVQFMLSSCKINRGAVSAWWRGIGKHLHRRMADQCMRGLYTTVEELQHRT